MVLTLNNSITGNHNGVGNEEGNVITLFTYSSTFLPSKNWTHIAGVHHIVCRSDDGLFSPKVRKI